MLTNNSIENQVRQAVQMIRLSVQAGRAPDQAAKEMASIVSHPILKMALEEYRTKVEKVWLMRNPGSIHDKNTESWYAGPSPDDVIWTAYAKKMAKSGKSKEVIDSVDAASTRVVSLLSPPGKARINSRGLVLGHVQSGKTASFMAVIAKAADAGYRVFIVFSGTNKLLRRQTQDRIQQDLVHDTDEKWFLLTSRDKDFSEKQNVNALLSGKHGLVLAVVKKNQKRLEKLTDWIQGARAEVLADCPVVVIDDEADQASPNAHKNAEERTMINELIVKLVGSIVKVAYVGYTATPFANFLIDPTCPEDLYPRDFIVSLPQSPGYFGTKEIFGRAPLSEADVKADGMDIIRIVPIPEMEKLTPPRRSRGSFRARVTPSLKTALLYYFLAVAARFCRAGKAKYCTMLIHVTHYTDAHEKIAKVVKLFLAETIAALELNDLHLLNQMKLLWETEQQKLPSLQFSHQPVLFADIQASLPRIIRDLKIKIENATSSLTDRVDYTEDDHALIVIGGNVLSRGVTFEGLLVSFFTRTASAYDTLLQMGRWFGYRHGYEDLPRVWTSQFIRDSFYDLASVEDEIRTDIARYHGSGLTPMDVAVRIRTHPSLSITSRLKMRHAIKAKMAFNGREVQTIVFRHRDRQWLDTNIQAVRKLATEIAGTQGGPEILNLKEKGSTVYLNVQSDIILSFLKVYQIDDNNSAMPAPILVRYIEEQNKHEKLLFWSVAFVGRRDSAALGTIDLGFSEPNSLVNRSGSDRFRGNDVVDIKALMSESDVLLDVEQASTEFLSRDQMRVFRDSRRPDRGMLLVYPISKDSRPDRSRTQRRPLEAVQHVMGIGLVFPDVDKGDFTPQTYVSVELPSESAEQDDLDVIINDEGDDE
jgi:hypothetical protein